MLETNLKNKLKGLPKKPGVYVFKNFAGKIIYIGKALSLKNRVSSYFQNKHKDTKTLELVENITDLQTILVNSEFEALLLEAKLIKQHKPKYNIQAKDGKSYLYIVIGKDFPNRVYSSRKPETEEKLLAWYGPFPSGRDVNEILRFIRKIFPFRSCAKLPKHTCLYYHLGLCPGVCVKNVIPSDPPAGGESRNPFPRKSGGKRSLHFGRDDDYRETIAQIKQILSGKTKKLISSLEKEMKSVAKNLDFEKAREVKSKIDALNRLTQGWKSVPKEEIEATKAIEEIKSLLIKHGGINLLAINKIEGYDVSNLSSQIIVGSMVVFVNAEPETSSYRKFNLKGYFDFGKNTFYNHQDDSRGIKQILSRRLNHPEWILPQLILVDGGKTQIGAAFIALKEKGYENQIAILGLTKQEETLIIPHINGDKIIGWKSLRLSRVSPALKLLQFIRDESHRFAQRYYKTLSSKKLTGQTQIKS